MAPRTGLPRPVRRLLSFATVAALATTLVVAVPAGRTLVRSSPVALVAYQMVFYSSALATLAVIGLRVRDRRPGRGGWILVGLGPVCFLLGSCVWQVLLGGKRPLPVPSAADALFLLVYPALFTGIMVLFRRQARRTPAAVWLDGVIGGLAVGSVAARFVLGPVFDLAREKRPGSSWDAVVTTLAYPVGDLMLLATVTAVLSILRGRAGAQWLFLLGGCAVLALTDCGFLLETALGKYHTPTLLDHGWQLAFMMIAVAGWTRDGHNVSARRVTPLAALPLAAASAATLVLVVPHGHGTGAGTGAGVSIATSLAAATVILTLVRLAVTIRETVRLADTHDLARTDELTGLPNRRAFYERTRHLSAAHATSGARHAVLLLDLDRFKEVNDSFGHLVGDDLLRLVGPRLAAQCGPDDLIARLGGDEFGIVVLGHEAAETVAGRLCASLDEPFVLRDLTMQISASVGVAHYPEDGVDGVTLLRRADVAMYAAKRTRSGWRAYDAAEDPNSPDRLHLLDALRTALAEGGRGLELHYQPKLGLVDGRLTGVEALVRWRHPRLGLLPPAAFLPLMEEYGLSRALTDVVLRQAVAQCSRWRDQGLHLPVAVNLPASLCTDPELPAAVGALLAQHHLVPGCLELEITEEFLLGDRVSAREVLEQLSALGVRVSIDDFGTGYSSLAYLRDLPVDTLKLDRTFITGMEDDLTTAALVRSAVSLSHSLGLEMVAEGVETEAALELLRQLGCDQAQGFHVGHPLPAAELTAWLATGEEQESTQPA